MKRIYVVEDDQDIRELLELVLNQRYTVVAFPNAKTFRQGIERKNVDLILMDIMLPDGNGKDLCEELGNTRETSDIPVVLMSAHAERSSFIEGHAKDFVAKPFNIEHLYATIDKYIL